MALQNPVLPSKTIAVVVTTYNHGELMLAAIRSIMTQSRPANEIIVVDDGSRENQAARVAEEFGSVVTYVHQENRGIASSRNRGVEMASSDLIAFMDGDDLWHPRKLEWQERAILRYPQSGIVGVKTIIFDPQEGQPVPEELPDEPRITHGNRLADLLVENFLWTVSSVAIPRDVLRNVGTSDRRYPLCSDFDLYCRIAAYHPVTYIDLPLTFWRYHATSASGPLERRFLTWGPELLSVLTGLRGHPGIPSELLEKSIRSRVLELGWHAWQYSGSGTRSRSLNVIGRLVSMYPTQPKIWFYLVATALGLPGRTHSDRVTR